VATAAGSELNIDHLLSIGRLVRNAGVTDVKLTGGDPALYGPLEEAVERLRTEAGFGEVEVISRHPRIGARAAGLARAGVTRFNMSVDTLDGALHREITGQDDHSAVLDALRACVATGVPVKINMVVMAGINEDEVADLVGFCEREGVAVLKLLDVIQDLDAGQESFTKRLARKGAGPVVRNLYAPLTPITERLTASAESVSTWTQGGLGHPMTVLSLASGLKVAVKDCTTGSWYGSVCGTCRLFPCHDALMALRLTADLRLQFCLLREDITVPLADLLDGDGRALEIAVRRALDVYAGAEFYATTPKMPMAVSS
jgi:cyclic pyranopterin phosphate synthase